MYNLYYKSARETLNIQSGKVPTIYLSSCSKLSFTLMDSILVNSFGSIQTFAAIQFSNTLQQCHLSMQSLQALSTVFFSGNSIVFLYLLNKKKIKLFAVTSVAVVGSWWLQQEQNEVFKKVCLKQWNYKTKKKKPKKKN